MAIRSFAGAALLLAVAGAAAAPLAPRAAQQLPSSLARHEMATTYGIPARYAGMTNPLPNDEATWTRGAEVYADTCASCHGAAGEGDGPAGQFLPTPPADLAWFATLPMSRWDGFIYWTIAEGGEPFDTSMPAYRDTLAEEDIWAVIAYMRRTLGSERRI
jgi:mono/diheme cytochrome c family protein